MARPMAARNVSTSYTAPRNEVETLLVELWQGTFRIQEIGVAENFFELGGHSLLAVQLLKNMNHFFIENHPQRPV